MRFRKKIEPQAEYWNHLEVTCKFLVKEKTLR
jgi:hypothetical protein